MDNEAAAKWVDIDLLVPWEHNPRVNDHAVAEVAKSIKRFGFGAPVLARLEDHSVIAGHTRLRAARELGMVQVPVRFLDLDAPSAKALALADNRLGELADWDEDALATALRELDEEALDLDGLGWSEAELAELLGATLLDAPAPDGGDDKPLTECPSCGHRWAK